MQELNNGFSQQSPLFSLGEVKEQTHCRELLKARFQLHGSRAKLSNTRNFDFVKIVTSPGTRALRRKNVLDMSHCCFHAPGAVCIGKRGGWEGRSGVRAEMEENCSSGKAKLFCLTSKKFKDKYIPYRGRINNEVQERLFE